MKLIPTAFFTALCLSFVLFTACNKNEDDDQDLVVNNNIIINAAQEVPVNPSTATGKMTAQYNMETNILTYTVTFSGLTGNASAAHIHGLGEPGFNAPVLQTFAGFPAAPQGAYSGSLFVDGVAIKEENILNGRFYVNIHTAMYPGGEIRGQITF